VRQLFLHTPVRRKFLRGTSTEFAHLAEQFTRIALAHPRLHLVLRHNDKPVYELPATERLIDRLELFFGGELARALIPVDSEHDGIRLWGYVAHPSQSKSTRKGQYLFLNGRWIQDRSLQHALSEAYRGLLMVGRHPVAFLFLDLPAELVDVNVHPTKSEVRFLDSQRLYRQLLSTLRTRFLGMDLGSVFDVRRAAAANESVADPERQLHVQQELVAWARDQLAGFQPNEDLTDLEAVVDQYNRYEADQLQLRTAHDVPQDVDTPGAAASSARGAPSPVSAFPAGVVHAAHAGPHPASPAAEVRAMQVHDCYLVVETGEGLTVIDQHALHERILYERLRERVLAGAVETQKLLMPVIVELGAREAGLILDQADLLAELGLCVESFGGQTIAVTAWPTLLHRADPTHLLRAVVEQIESTGQSVTRRDLLDSLLHMLACKAAIKAGQRLSAEEIEELLAQRRLVDDHHHCPHGRPTALTLSRTDLDRQFGRLG
jgi:DNA mismatch repair protein MutL